VLCVFICIQEMYVHYAMLVKLAYYHFPADQKLKRVLFTVDTVFIYRILRFLILFSGRSDDFTKKENLTANFLPKNCCRNSHKMSINFR